MINSGLKPENLFYMDSDQKMYSFAKERLIENGFLERNMYFVDSQKTGLKDSDFDVIYANNFIHCLENIFKIDEFFKESFRILNNDGVMFGRTLFNEIYMDKIEKLEENDFFRYTAHLVESGKLLGLEPSNVESFAKSNGFINFRYSLEDISSKPVRNFYFCAEKR
jgi:ubiquinone/menaquinone biosynthesis C-methylase UbiE